MEVFVIPSNSDILAITDGAQVSIPTPKAKDTWANDGNRMIINCVAGR